MKGPKETKIFINEYDGLQAALAAKGQGIHSVKGGG